MGGRSKCKKGPNPGQGQEANLNHTGNLFRQDTIDQEPPLIAKKIKKNDKVYIEVQLKI